jgi:hypothetical protein
VLVIVPDDKDWTWVIDRACPECGFDAGLPVANVPHLIRANAGEWQERLAAQRIGAGRPDGATWSSLEYACHVRDVYRRYLVRVELMLTEHDPLFPNWDQDATAIDDGYEQQDPVRVIADLREAADRLASRLDGVTDALWQRPGRRSDGARFTVDTIARYMVHDTVHHIWDVDRQPHPV